MCLIPGLADGRYLTEDGVIGQEEVVEAWCGCAGSHDDDGGHGVTRRGALGRLAGAAAGLALAGIPGPSSAAAEEAVARTASSPDLDPDAPAQVVFLGTNGGPVLSPVRSQPAHALIVNGVAYLVDGGGDVLWQLSRAGVPLSAVRHLLITHYHSDHVAGYPALAILGWSQVPALKRLDVWGPTVHSMHRSLARLFKGDIGAREFMTGVRPFDSVVFGHDVHIGRGNHRVRKVFEDRNVEVNAVRVSHGTFAEMPYAYGYRFDVKSGPSGGKSVVFSGDTTPTDAMSRLARDCDLLAHEAIYAPGIEELLQSVDPAVRDSLREHIFSTHTDVTEIPKVAKNANAKRVILTHLSPGSTPPSVWLSTAQDAAAAIGYNLDMAVSGDLDVVVV